MKKFLKRKFVIQGATILTRSRDIVEGNLPPSRRRANILVGCSRRGGRCFNWDRLADFDAYHPHESSKPYLLSPLSKPYFVSLLSLVKLCLTYGRIVMFRLNKGAPLSSLTAGLLARVDHVNSAIVVSVCRIIGHDNTRPWLDLAVTFQIRGEAYTG
jgi:hypothetical protein